ncbi:nucleotidyltransferase domain-containing protein [Streptacidiphilus sp. MAP5-52]|uniref:nucleotidyltransferase domain-containing protein n=1 Tax=Streptacidiphilus sp. MAP5-52 TaxID=3156267 RepID=UPI003518A491
MSATTTGLDSDGYIAREGSLDRVPSAYAPVVATARDRIAAAFDPGSRLHSAYLYGSIPRGTAVPGVSDLDLLLVLHEPPTPADREAADALASSLDATFPFVNGVGVLLFDATTVLSELERHDLGWFLACLCTPLLGPDLAAQLPRYRPDSLLARETNGDLALALPRWRERLAAVEGDLTTEHDLAARRVLCRSVARRLVRTGLTLVMPRWGGWTSDLRLSAQIFARYYPARATQMHLAATVARTPTDDRSVLHTLVDDLAPWLATEYTAVHGTKAPRD